MTLIISEFSEVMDSALHYLQPIPYMCQDSNMHILDISFVKTTFTGPTYVTMATHVRYQL